MTESTFAAQPPHALGRYTLEWHISPVEKRLAVYEVTGKKNDVYVQASHLPAGKWMPRHYFEHWVYMTKKKLGGRESKPTSKGWKRVSGTPA